MRVLVTNDDGVDAPGLQALAGSMHEAGHEVRVVAPSREYSGSSAGLGVVADGARIAIRDVDEPVWHDLRGVEVRAVDAPPALAVRAMCAGAFGWRPECVVSGVNPGFNTGRLVIHSGTVGAALTAGSFEVHGVAVSTAADSATGAWTAAVLAGWLVEMLAERESPVVLNLNVPAVGLGDLAGVRAAALSMTGYIDLAWQVAPDALEVTRTEHAPPFTVGTDADALAGGFAPLSVIDGPWAERQDVSDLAAALHDRVRDD